FTKLVSHLPKCHIIPIIWLLTTHIALNKHLHCIKKAESPFCPYCDGRTETVEHYLISCPQYLHEWHILHNSLGRNVGNLPYLISQPKAIMLLIIFVNSTGQLKEASSNIPP
ncbi:hypothetical protein PAXRUDRAFT_82295, partial [Paxillus rubicundulus Ve08.2h10]